MKTDKISILVICLILVSSALSADEIKGKVTFRGGGAFSLFSSSTRWDRSWGFRRLEVAQEGGSQSIEGNNAFLFSGSVAVFITPQFAIEGIVGYVSANAPIRSTYNETHYWWDPFRRGPYSNSYNYSTDGSLSVVPISLNGLFQVETWRSITPYISGGLSIAPSKFKADTYTGFVHSVYIAEGQLVDVIQNAQLKIDRSFTSLGFNIGGGADIKITSSLAINVEARYIHLQKKNFAWGMMAGTFQGMFGRRWDFNEDFVREFGNKYLGHALTVNPSIFSISGGITIRF